MEYKFSGTLTLKDYIQCCQIFNRKRNIFLAIFLYIAFLLIIFGSYDFSELKDFISDNPLNIFFVISHKEFIPYFIGITLFIIIAYFVIHPIYYMRLYKSDKMIKAERSFCITDEYINVY
ncbi:MAG: hypothetical protein LBH44_02155 [Treponema sp.]|nr:hypothetical protein [Treponema sp.]